MGRVNNRSTSIRLKYKRVSSFTRASKKSDTGVPTQTVSNGGTPPNAREAAVDDAAPGDAVSYLFVYATAGAEYRSGGGPGLFAEVQPLYELDRNPFTGDASAGALGGKLTLGVFYP